MLQKFIRIDMKGHWRGTEHRSSVQGRAGECTCDFWCWCEEECYCNKKCKCGGNWEAGISCYEIGDNIAVALENLREYWTGIASCDIEDFRNFQITIFEGELLPVKGSDWEDLATCERTLYELEAYPIMKAVIEAHERICTYGDPDEDEITEEEYEDFLRGLIAC